MRPLPRALVAGALVALGCGLGAPPKDECGDGIWGPTEPCEPSDAVFGAWCTDRCTWHECGDGILASWEVCELGDEGCDVDCTLAGCGNGIAGVGEVCLEEQTRLETGERPVAIVVVDLDGDGLLDVLTANEAARTVSVHRNAGGVFSREDVEVGVAPATLVVAQLDEIHGLDLLVTSTSEPSVGVTLAGELGSWGEPRAYPLASPPAGVVPLYPPPQLSGRVGDLHVWLPEEGAVQILRGECICQGGPAMPTGTFSPVEPWAEVSASPGTFWLAPAREDPSGDVPAAAMLIGDDGRVIAWEWTSDWAPLVAYGGNVIPDARQAVPTSHLLGGRGRDLLVLGEDRVALYRGDLGLQETGGNGAALAVSTPGARAMAALQLDGVEREDLVYTAGDDLVVHVDNGWQSNGFRPEGKRVPVGDAPGPVAVGDLDGDGYDDVVVAHPDHDAITILWSRP